LAFDLADKAAPLISIEPREVRYIACATWQQQELAETHLRLKIQVLEVRNWLYPQADPNTRHKISSATINSMAMMMLRPMRFMPSISSGASGG
jgi:hypothetical protein